MNILDSIIIGAGFSGLSTARTLVKAGYSPLILEARNRLGGRAYTLPDDEHGGPVDAGCAQIHGYLEGNPMAKLNAELGLPSAHIVKDAQTLVVASDPNFQSKILDPEAASLLFASAGGAIPVSSPYPPPPPSDSLATTYLSKIDSSEVRSMVRMAEIGAGITLEAISARWWGFGRGCVGTDGAPAAGYSQIIQSLATEIQKTRDGTGAAEIKLGEEVVAIEEINGQDADGPKLVQVKTQTGNVYTARTCVCTIPLGVLKASPPEFIPSLDKAFLASVQRTTVGTLEKIILSYDEIWWPQSDVYGTYILLPPTQSSPSPSTFGSLADMFARTLLPVSNHARTAARSHPTLLVYIGATAGEYLSKFSLEDISSALHEYIVSRLLPNRSLSSLPKPRHSTVTRWLTDPYSRGATSSPVSLSVVDGEAASPLDFVVLLRSTWGGALGFAGEHTDLDGRGSVVGALASGKREGERVVALLERRVRAA